MTSELILTVFHGVLPDMEKSLISWDCTENPTIEPFEFETGLDPNLVRRKMWNEWPLYIQIVLAYFVTIHVVQWIMRDQKPFMLITPLAIWNFGMAAFSAMAFCRFLPELTEVLSGDDGFHRSICVRDTLHPSTMFWTKVVLWSKMVEFGDTLFIILRKKPLIFLHWYHHGATFLFVAFSAIQGEPALRYYGINNALVHTIMYTYFAISTLGYKAPKLMSMGLTLLQICQFLVGIAINLYAVGVKWNGHPCAVSDESSRLTSFMFGSYLVLFLHFFCRSYFSRRKKGV